jgi:hypothetical protein
MSAFKTPRCDILCQLYRRPLMYDHTASISHWVKQINSPDELLQTE